MNSRLPRHLAQSIRILFFGLSLLGVSAFFSGLASEEALQKITLKDGSVLYGQLSSFSDGVYTFKVNTLGNIKVKVAEVVSIENSALVKPAPVQADAAETVSRHTTSRNRSIQAKDMAPADGSQANPAGTMPDFQGMVQNIQQNPAMMNQIMSLQSDPKFMENLLAISLDPEVQKAMNSGNMTEVMDKMMKNPRMKEILQNQGLQNLMQTQEMKQLNQDLKKSLPTNMPLPASNSPTPAPAEEPDPASAR